MATERGVRFSVYQDKAGEWRWRLIAGNGKTVCDSGEGYGRRAACVYAVDRVQTMAGRAMLEVEPPGGAQARRKVREDVVPRPLVLDGVTAAN